MNLCAWHGGPDPSENPNQTSCDACDAEATAGWDYLEALNGDPDYPAKGAA